MPGVEIPKVGKLLLVIGDCLFDHLVTGRVLLGFCRQKFLPGRQCSAQAGYQMRDNILALGSQPLRVDAGRNLGAPMARAIDVTLRRP
jgi:hypothetical protein